MKLIVGLGNPGKQYSKTRHNVGFLSLNKLEDKYDLEYKFDSSFNALIAIKIISGEKCYFVKPQTFMNLSGEAVGKIVHYYKIDIKDMIVIYDDMDLPFGSLRLRQKGSAGGHNGIKNIIAHLGTDEFKRIRVGISGHANIDAKDYVLGKFSNEELIGLDLLTDHIAVAIAKFIQGISFEIIMGEYNTVKI